MYNLGKFAKEPKRKISASDWWGFVYGVGVFLIIVAICTLLFQCGWWLRYGFWPEWPFLLPWVSIGLPYPASDWGGVDRIISWIMERPTFLVLGVVGYLLSWFGTAGAEGAEKREREEAERLKRLSDDSDPTD